MKPREFWIKAAEFTNEEDMVFHERVHGVNLIHVIEYAAYESLIESLIYAKKQRDAYELKWRLLLEKQNES